MALHVSGTLLAVAAGDIDLTVWEANQGRRCSHLAGARFGLS